jgi:hypothetical protein
VKTNKEQTKALAEEATRWLQTLVNSLNDAKADRSEMARMEPYTNQMFQYAPGFACAAPLDIHYRVLNTIAKSTKRCANRGKAQRLLKKSQDAEELTQHRERLKDVYDRFMVRY